MSLHSLAGDVLPLALLPVLGRNPLPFDFDVSLTDRGAGLMGCKRHRFQLLSAKRLIADTGDKTVNETMGSSEKPQLFPPQKEVVGQVLG